MNRLDRIIIGKIKDCLKESFYDAKKDRGITISTEEEAYYQGLSEGYGHAYELIRKLK